MGYYTFFSLIAKTKKGGKFLWYIPNGEQIEKEIAQTLARKLGWFDGCDWDKERIEKAYADIESLEFISNDTMKWYDHDEDMKELSKQYPDYVFELYGDGEETDDEWYTYYCNGEVQYAPVEKSFAEDSFIEYWEG